MSGTMRALVANMVHGVTKGFEKQAHAGRRRLPRAGAGRQAQPDARLLAPGGAPDAEGRQGRDADADRDRDQGIDKQQVGQVAAEMRALPPARAVQGQGRALRRRGRRAQRDEEEVTGRHHERQKNEARLRRARQTRHQDRARRRACASPCIAPTRTSTRRSSRRPATRCSPAPRRWRRTCAASSRTAATARRPRLVGKRIAEKAKELGIETVAFDRAGFRYHGRVKALADAAREGGLKF